jgi:hypothetical protein
MVKKSVKSSKEFLSTFLVLKTGFEGVEIKRKSVLTLPWVIIRETAIASNTCPVVFLCLNLLLLLEEKQ